MILRTARILYRLPLLSLHIVYAILLLLFFVRHRPRQMNERDWRFINHWTRGFCRILNIHITIHGTPIKDPALYVANHISWHDIAVLHAVLPVCFIAKHEIRRWPLVGWLAYRGGTLFIHRGARDAFYKLRKTLHTCLQARQNVLFFPEGTTTNGRHLLRFKYRLFGPGIEQQRPLQAIALRYKHSERITFIGEEPFLSHLLRTLGEKRIDAEIFFCPAIDCCNKTDKALAETTQQQIAKVLALPVMTANGATLNDETS